MKLSIALLASLCLVSQATPPFRSQSDAEWFQYKQEFGKTYSTASEEFLRRMVFEHNMVAIKQHNAEYNQGLHSFTMGPNSLSDLTNAEYRLTRLGYRGLFTEDAPERFEFDASAPLPASVDWRTKGLVTPVKDQGSCGSCWAFSTIGSTEGQHAKVTGKLVSLSERQLVDCSFLTYGNFGCFGGQMDNAFKYLVANNGSDTESSYPYTDVSFENCEKNGTIGAKIKSYADIKSGDEAALQAAVANIGPISIAIDASQKSFQAYKSGVYYEPACSNSSLDHGVTLVGYGTDNGADYWIVKNSWNTTWGDQGYIKMARNRDNNCGIATRASYPVASA